MFPISASQIRAARGLLHWTQDELADKAKVSRATVQAIENGDTKKTGKASVRTTKIRAIYKTLKDHGIEFLEGDGVRRQPEGLKDFTGYDSCDRFFEHVEAVIKEKGGDLICSINHQDMLTKTTGSTERTNLERLEQLQKLTDVECIISDEIIPPFIEPSFQVRVLPEEPTIIPTSSFAYGDELVIAFHDNNMHLTFVVFQKISFRRHFQNYFLPRWQVAKPLLVMPPVEQKKHRVRAYA